jgi:cell division protein FtsL
MAASQPTAALPEPSRGPGAFRPAPRRRRRERRVRGGIVWIAFLTVLLTGVVAVNVAVLRVNMRLDELGRERANLRAQNAQLASQLSSSAAPGRIQALARAKLGAEPVGPGDTTYVELPRAP